MPVRFPCNACGQLLGIGTRKIGATINCPNCSAALTVPTEEAAEELRRQKKRPGGNGSMADTPFDIALPRQHAAAFVDDDVDEVLAALDNLGGGAPRSTPPANPAALSPPASRPSDLPDNKASASKPKTNGQTQPNREPKPPFVPRIVPAKHPQPGQTNPTSIKPQPAQQQSAGKANGSQPTVPVFPPTSPAAESLNWESLAQPQENQALLEPVTEAETSPAEPGIALSTEVTDYGLNLADPFSPLIATAVNAPALPADAYFENLQTEPARREPLIPALDVATSSAPLTSRHGAVREFPSTAAATPYQPNAAHSASVPLALPDGIWITHKMLFVQVGLLVGLSLLTFVLGWMAGGGMSSRPAPTEETNPPARLALLVQYLDAAQKTSPDVGAVVLIWPKGSRPAERIASQGFKPGDAELPASAPARQTIDLLGGTYGRVGNDGKLELSVPRGGNYSVLIVSKNAMRPAAERMKDNELILLGELFGEEAPDVVGTAAYRLKSEKLTGTVALNHLFQAK